jgi:hypothetical protein
VTRRTLFHIFSATPAGRHMVSRRTAIFLTRSGTRQIQEVPAGKNPRSPGPNRRSSPFSSVMKTSPATTTTASSWLYWQVKRPAVHSHTTMSEVKSRLLRTFQVRVTGAPLKTQRGNTGCVWAPWSNVRGVVMTMDLGVTQPVDEVLRLMFHRKLGLTNAGGNVSVLLKIEQFTIEMVLENMLTQWVLQRVGSRAAGTIHNRNAFGNAPPMGATAGRVGRCRRSPSLDSSELCRGLSEKDRSAHFLHSSPSRAAISLQLPARVTVQPQRVAKPPGPCSGSTRCRLPRSVMSFMYVIRIPA